MGTTTMLARNAFNPQTLRAGVRLMSSDKRPMTRFIQYPFDKTKMAEVRAWVKDEPAIQNLRKIEGVKDLEISFCPGQGWLAARYIFNDLEDMKRFPDAPEYDAAKVAVVAHPFYDKSRDPVEFKGFFLEEA